MRPIHLYVFVFYYAAASAHGGEVRVPHDSKALFEHEWH